LFVQEEGLESGRNKRVAVIRKAAWNKERVRKDVTPLYGAVWAGLGHEVVYNGTLELSFHFTSHIARPINSNSITHSLIYPQVKRCQHLQNGAL
jgi:hypothetical protein